MHIVMAFTDRAKPGPFILVDNEGWMLAKRPNGAPWQYSSVLPHNADASCLFTAEEVEAAAMAKPHGAVFCASQAAERRPNGQQWSEG